MQFRKPHVVVFFGGQDGNHDLSAETGYWVCQFMPREKFDVTPVRINNAGEWQVPSGSLPRKGSVQKLLSGLFSALTPVAPVAGLGRLLRRPVEAMMTLVRGRGGDDGSLHGLGKSLNIPVIGSPLTTCQQTSDKYAASLRLGEIVSYPYTRRFRQGEEAQQVIAEVRRDFTAPLFVKPLEGEGSLGIEEVLGADELASALKRGLEMGDIVVQPKTPGTEVSVSIFRDAKGKLKVLSPTVIEPKHTTYYDHLAKRRAGRVNLHTAEEDQAVIQEAAGIAREIYEELNCAGLVSLDFMVEPQLTEILEVNTVPTLTPLTPLWQQLKADKFEPSRLLDQLVQSELR